MRSNQEEAQYFPGAGFVRRSQVGGPGLPDNLNRLVLTGVLLKEGSAVFAVRSRSMEPLLREGDQIEIGPVDKETILPGHIVVFEATDDSLVCHRIVARWRYKGRLYFSQAGEVHRYGMGLPSERIVGLVRAFWKGSAHPEKILLDDDRSAWMKANRRRRRVEALRLVATTVYHRALLRSNALRKVRALLRPAA